MAMARWIFAALLVLQAHFAASYIVPLDKEGQGAFGGLLRWAGPWGLGDAGLLGPITTPGSPVAGFFLAAITAGVSVLATLAVLGIWIPFGWWRALTIGGAVLLLVLMVLFFGPTKVLPMALALGVLWIATTQASAVPAP
jgi:hypothetical protein